MRPIPTAVTQSLSPRIQVKTYPFNSILREFFSIFRARQGYFARRESRIFWFDNLRRFHRPNPVSLARGVDLRLPQNFI